MNQRLGALNSGTRQNTLSKDEIDIFLQSEGALPSAEAAPSGYLTSIGVFGSVAAQHDSAIGLPPAGIRSQSTRLPAARPGRHTVYNFTVEGLHTYVAGDYRVHNNSFEDIALAGSIGSSLGRFAAQQITSLFTDNVAVNIVAGALGGTIGGYAAASFAADLAGVGGQKLAGNNLTARFTVDRIPQQFAGHLITAGVNYGSSLLARKIVGSLGIDNEIVSGIAEIVISTGAEWVALNAIASTDIGGDLLAGFGYGGWSGAQLANAGAGALGSFLGAQVAGFIFDTQNIGAQIGGALGGMVASFALKAALGGAVLTGPAAPIFVFAAAFVGTFLGSAIGSFLGGGNEFPNGHADVNYIEATRSFGVTSADGDNGADQDDMIRLGNSMAASVNSILELVGGTVANPDAMFHRVGLNNDGNFYAQGPGYGDRNDQDEKTDAGVAVQFGTVKMLKRIQLEGGDPYLKQAIKNSNNWESLEAFGEDLSVAAQYAQYMDNPVLFDQRLAELDPNNAREAAILQEWQDVLDRAQALGLHNALAEDDLHLGEDATKVLLGTTSAESLEGGLGADLIDGRGGMDTLRGGAGDDVYFFKTGYGDTTIHDHYEIAASYHIERNPPNSDQKVNYSEALDAGIDTLQFGEGIGPDNISLALSGNDLIVTVVTFTSGGEGGATSEQITIKDWNKVESQNGQNNLNNRIERFRFASGMTFYPVVQGAAVVLASEGLMLEGTGAGTLEGSQAEDVLSAGLGVDSLIGGAGDDRYRVGRGSGSLSILDDGSYTEHYSEARFDGTGTYHHGGEGGSSSYQEWSTVQKSYVVGRDGGWDALEFAEGIVAQDLVLKLDGDDLIVGVKSEDRRDDPTPLTDEEFNQLADRFRIENWRIAENSIEVFRLADGTEYGVQVLQVAEVPSDFVDSIYSFRPGDGAREIRDSYSVDQTRVEDHYTRINESIEIDGGIDRIVLGSGVSESDLVLRLEGDDLLIGIRPAGVSHDVIELFPDRLRVVDWRNENNRVEFLQFHPDIVKRLSLAADGVTPQLTDSVVQLVGTSSADSLVGSFVEDRLDGGLGNDQLNGGAGSDTYFYGRGDGLDTVFDDARTYYQIASAVRDPSYDIYQTQSGGSGGGGEGSSGGGGSSYLARAGWREVSVDQIIERDGGAADTIEFDASISGIDALQFHFDGNDLIIGIKGVAQVGTTLTTTEFDALTDKIVIKDWLLDAHRVEQIRFDGDPNPIQIIDHVVLPDGSQTNGPSTEAVPTLVSIDTPETGEIITEAYSAPVIAFHFTQDDFATLSAGLGFAHFDIDNDGFQEQIGWIRPGDALLVWDRNSDGLIDKSSELFTTAPVGTYGPDGPVSLASLDLASEGGNADGVLGREDTKFDELRLWFDYDGDGQVNVGELISLRRAGIGQVVIESTPLSDAPEGLENAGNHVQESGYFTLLGERIDPIGQYYSVSFAHKVNGMRVVPELLDGQGQGTGYAGIEYENGGTVALPDSVNDTTLGDVAGVATVVSGSGLADLLDASTLTGIAVGDPGIQFSGGDGADTIIGSAGDDILIGGRGADTLLGGAGNDQIEADDEDSLTAGVVSGGDGDDVLIYSGSNALHLDIGQLGFEAAVGGAGNDFLRHSTAEGVVLGGGEGDDTLEGTVGDDFLEGGFGNDSLIGGAGNDDLRGDRGTDYLSGGLGDDIIFFDAADLAGGFVDGGEGTDIAVVADIVGVTLDLSAHGFEEAIGGQGDDRFLAGQVDGAVLTGAGGNDTLVSGAGSDYLSGGAGSDSVSYEQSDAAVTVNLLTGELAGGHAVGDSLFSIEGVIGSRFNDTLTGDDGANTLDGHWGADALAGGLGDDTYVLRRGGGVDTITEAGGTDSILFGAGLTGEDIAVEVVGGALHIGIKASPDDTTPASQLRDRLVVTNWQSATSRIESLVFADGSELSLTDGWAASDAQALVTQGQTVTGSLLPAAFGSLSAGYSIAVLTGPSHGALSTNDSTGTFSFTANAGYLGIDSFTVQVTSTLDGFTFSETITVNVTVGDGTAEIRNGADGNDAFVGGAGSDIFGGGLGDDSLVGGGGDDTLAGEAGNDVLHGGAGADRLIGSQGIDTASYAGSAAAVAVDLGDGTGFGGDAEGDALLTIENVIGSNFADVLTGDAEANRLEGGAGADTLSGAAGDDVLKGGADADQLSGGEGSDELFGEAGADSLSGDGGADWLDGGAGDDTLSGGAGDDVLIGGSGADVLSGGLGDDTYVLRRGGGVDIVSDAGGADRILVGEGLTGDDIVTEVVGGVLHIGIKETPGDLRPASQLPDRLVIQNWQSLDRQIEIAEFTDGSVLGLQAGNATAVVQQGQSVVGNLVPLSAAMQSYQLVTGPSHGVLSVDVASGTFSFAADAAYLGLDAFEIEVTSTLGGVTSSKTVTVDIEIGDGAAQIVSGTAAQDALSGGGGNDVFDGFAGDDVLSGGAGDDTLRGGAGSDLLHGGSGGDELIGGDGVDTASYIGSSAAVTADLGTGVASGGDAQGDILTGVENLIGSDHDDSLTGDALANRLEGGGRNDTLSGGAGDDVLDGGGGSNHFHDGAGNDTAYGYGGNDRFYDGAGDDLAYANGGNDYFYDGAGNDTAYGGTGRDRFFSESGNNLFDGGDGDDLVDYGSADVGVVLDLAAGIASYGSYQDTLISIEDVNGDSFDDELRGDAGDNYFQAYGGNDLLDGREGNDFLWGGSGSDTLIGGSGADTLSGGPSGVDVASYAGSTAGVTVDLVAGTGVGGDAEGDSLVSIDNLIGSDHGDSLTGSRFANRLEGGAGADTLSGGDGDDRYAYGLGDGDDVIVNAETAPVTADDRLVFGQGIDTDDLWFTQEGDDLLVQILDNQRGSLRIQDWYAAGSTGDSAKLDAFETSAGQVLVEANLQQLVDAMAGLPANGSDVVDSYKDQVPASVQTAISQAWSSS